MHSASAGCWWSSACRDWAGHWVVGQCVPVRRSAPRKSPWRPVLRGAVRRHRGSARRSKEPTPSRTRGSMSSNDGTTNWSIPKHSRSRLRRQGWPSTRGQQFACATWEHPLCSRGGRAGLRSVRDAPTGVGQGEPRERGVSTESCASLGLRANRESQRKRPTEVSPWAMQSL
jgi:hypothetical protein